MKNMSMNTPRPLQMSAAALVFLLPCLSLITKSGASALSFLFLLLALLTWSRGHAALARHWDDIRWVVLAFLLNFAFAAFCYMVRPEAPLSSVERPARMFFAVTALMVVLVARPSRRLLWWGVSAGAFAGMLLIAHERIALNIDRPGGYLNAITFGDLALTLALLALAGVIDERVHWRRAVWPALGAFAGLAASLMTGTRGSFVALAFAGLVFACYGKHFRSLGLRALVGLCFALVAATYFVPATGVRERVQNGVDDVRNWQTGGNKFTNVGTRLELWKGAAMLIAERPVFGRAAETWKNELGTKVAARQLDPVVLTMPHLHNEFLQSLATGGVFGLLAWFGTLAAPFVFFARMMRGHAPGQTAQLAPAIGGLLTVVAFFGFGLTEVIFWSIHGSLFYALMVFVLMGLCLNAKEKLE